MNKELSQKWFEMSLTNSKNALYAIRLSGLMVKHQNLIKQAVANKLTEADTQKVINWIVNNLPKTANDEQDSMILETAWMIYSIGVYRDSEPSDNETENAAQFLTKLRQSYLLARVNRKE